MQTPNTFEAILQWLGEKSNSTAGVTNLLLKLVTSVNRKVTSNTDTVVNHNIWAAIGW